MKKVLFTIILFVSSNFVFAQGNLPVDAFSVGTEVYSGMPTYGVVGNYAISANTHLGVKFGMLFDTGFESANGQEEDGATFMQFGAYFKYYFSNIRNMMPFVRVGADIISEEIRHQTLTGNGAGSRLSDHTNLYVECGGSWFPFNNLALHGGIRFFDYNTSKANMKVGLGSPFLGLDFYL